MMRGSAVAHDERTETSEAPRPREQASHQAPVPRFTTAFSLVMLSVLTVTWALLLRRFEQGGVYWTMGAYALVVALYVGADVGSVLRRQLQPSLPLMALGLAAGAAMTVATYPAYALASEWFPSLPGHVAELYADSRQEPLGVAVWWVVVILAVEELLWRSAWIERLSTYLDPRLAAATSVALYSAAQLGSGSWIVGLLALCCGTVWTALRMWTGSLWPPLLAHLVWTPVVILLNPIA